MHRLRVVALSVAVAAAGLALAATTFANPSGAATVGGIYRGDDGGALYLRQIGSSVYGFAEHPGQGYATVLSGTLAGNRINGTWWDVPKGTRQQTGPLRLTWSQDGARIVRTSGGDFGPDVFTRLPQGASIPWPGKREAGFQAKSATDFDGAYRADDGSAHYVVDNGTTLVWVGERFPQLGTRPAWTTIFVGARIGADRFTGQWVDLPKGSAAGAGAFVAVRERIDRSIALTQAGVSRSTELATDWALDMNQFVQSLRASLDGNVVGYAFAVTKHGAVTRAWAGGSRRLPSDGERLPFTTKTQNSAASTTKLVTAMAVMRVLAEKGLPATTPVAPYLPSCWNKAGKDIDKLTFRDLLDHSSRIDRGLGSTACAGNPYECLRRSIENGQTGSAGYDNINYTLFRYLLPLVENREATDAVFERYNCGDAEPGNVRSLTNWTNINRAVSRRFESIVASRLLKPFGIKAGYSTTGNDKAFGYAYVNQGAPGQAPNERSWLTGGSGGMKWSADAYARLLAAFETGRIVDLATVRQMKSGLVGFDRGVAGAAGTYYTKNGASGNFASQVMVYPGSMGAYVTVNSSGNATTASLATMLSDAFEAALR